MRSKRYKDPVYGYIELDGDLFEHYIDSPEFQRLQHVRQTGYTPLYASATHNRFVHSIGVYYLGRLAFQAFEKSAHAIEDFDSALWNSVRDIFLRACLLHDIGHAPFSHAGEDFYSLSNPSISEQLDELVNDAEFSDDLRYYAANPANPHEIMSALVGLRTFEEHFESDDDRALFARCITGYAYRTPRHGVLARNAVISLLNSTTIDVDKLDYLIRDAFVTGFRNTAIDYERLLSGISFHRFSKDDDRFELAYEKSSVSVLENVVYARDSERKWIQNHPVILYEGMLVSHMMESVAERFFNSSAELFCVDALSNEGMVLNGRKVRLLSDDDILCYAKQIEDDPCIDWYFNRGSRHKPFWKSEAEFKAVFRSRLGNQYEKLSNNFKSLEKHLLEVTGRPVINADAVTAMEKYVAQIQEETQKAEDSVKKEFQSNLRQYQRSLKIMDMLDDFVSSLPGNVRLSFTVLSAPDFNSGFAPGKLEATKIHIPQQDQLSILSDIVSLPRMDKSDGSFFYLYSDEKDKIDTAALEEMLLQYAYGL